MSRVGVLGGTFDPVHLGHTGVALTAAEELNLSAVYFMPAYIQPFKQDRYTASPEDRLNMLNIATSENELFKVTDRELRHNRVSYTFDTLTEMIEEHPDDEIYFIMGSDSLLSLDKWYKGAELMALTSFAVGLRPNADKKAVEQKTEELMEKYGARIALLKQPMVPVSSTEVRRLLEEEKPISGLVNPMVEEYILRHKLYAAYASVFPDEQ